MKALIERLLGAALQALPADSLPADLRTTAPVVERTREGTHGDFATNLAMRLAKPARQNPRQLAQALVAALPADASIAKVEIAGPGFINFFLAPQAYHQELGRVLDEGAAYGSSNVGEGRRAIVEFVSANPTGPLHVGHGRQAAYGATLANLLDYTGHVVHREYYINDAGRQMDILAASAWLRYLEACGETLTFPSNGYRGGYVRELGDAIETAVGRALFHPAAAVFANLPKDEPDGGDKDLYVDAIIERTRQLIGADGYRRVLDVALERMLAGIRDDLAEFGVTFERWYSERALGDEGAIDRALARLEKQGHLYVKDGATWFRATEFRDEKDRVVVRENGQKTYFASDIAYHLEKRERGFDLLLDVLGADHHGYVARVRGGLEAMGEPGDCLEVCLIQFVSLFRGEEKIPMGKRDGQFVTLRQLREEVGNDACRLFYLMRSHDQPLDFDLELAKSRSNDNPVYYIQYAHARIASVFRQLADRGLAHDLVAGRASLGLLAEPHERALMSSISKWPELVESATAQRGPHLLVHYLRDLANDFHSYYNALPFLVDDAALRDARLTLLVATRQVLLNGLRLLGVSAPDTM